MKVFEILHLWKRQLLEMELTENPLVGGWLNFGQFDAFKSRSTSKRKFLNRLIRLIVLFNLVKLFIIILAEWLGFPDLKLYLIEVHFFEINYQKLIDVAILIQQLGLNLGLSHWVRLDEKALKSFRFLLIPEDPKDRHRYAQRYQLDPQSADKFFALNRLASTFLRLMIPAYSIFALAVISRCLYHSFYTVNLVYFLTASLLLSVLTLTTYLLFTLFIVPKFVLVLLSTRFLICRLKGVNTLLCKRFTKTELTSVSKPKKLRRQTGDLLKVLENLSDFCQQFQQINFVIDTSISTYLVGLFIFLYLLPYFLFFTENELSIRLLFGFLSIITYMLCISFSICNDLLRRQVRQ